MMFAASYPPLHKTQGRGTHSFITERKTGREGTGHPPIEIWVLIQIPVSLYPVKHVISFVVWAESRPGNANRSNFYNHRIDLRKTGLAFIPYLGCVILSRRIDKQPCLIHPVPPSKTRRYPFLETLILIHSSRIGRHNK